MATSPVVPARATFSVGLPPPAVTARPLWGTTPPGNGNYLCLACQRVSSLHANWMTLFAGHVSPPLPSPPPCPGMTETRRRRRRTWTLRKCKEVIYLPFSCYWGSSVLTTAWLAVWPCAPCAVNFAFFQLDEEGNVWGTDAWAVSDGTSTCEESRLNCPTQPTPFAVPVAGSQPSVWPLQLESESRNEGILQLGRARD